MIIRWQKNRALHVVSLYRDLAGDWIIEEHWSEEKDTGTRMQLGGNFKEARTRLLGICRQLRARGFHRASRREEQLNFQFDD